MSLWCYLSEILEPFQHCDNATGSVTFSSPRYVHLLLRYVECGLLIRDLTEGQVKRNINIRALLSTLDDLIESPSVGSAAKSRALCLRAVGQYSWKGEKIMTLDEQPVSEQAVEILFKQVRDAVDMTHGESTKEAAFSRLIFAFICKRVGVAQEEQSFEKVLEQYELCDRDDLYLSRLIALFRLRHIRTAGNVAAFRASLPTLQKMLCLGEYGRMLYDRWWEHEYRNYYGKTDPWKTACLDFKHADFKPKRYSDVFQDPVYSSSSQSLVNHTGRPTPAQMMSPAQVVSQPAPAHSDRSSTNHLPRPSKESRSDSPVKAPSQQTPVEPKPKERPHTGRAERTHTSTQIPESSAPLQKVLPPNWERRVDEKGQVFFLNHDTHTIHRQRWQEEAGICELLFAENGKAYVLNHGTNVSTWLDSYSPSARKHKPGSDKSSSRPPLTHIVSAPASTTHSSPASIRRTSEQAATTERPPHHAHHPPNGARRFARQLANTFIREAVRDVTQVVNTDVTNAINNFGGGWSIGGGVWSGGGGSDGKSDTGSVERSSQG